MARHSFGTAHEFVKCDLKSITFLLDARVSQHFLFHGHDPKGMKVPLPALKGWEYFLLQLEDDTRHLRRLEIRTDIFSEQIEFLQPRGRSLSTLCHTRFDTESMRSIQSEHRTWMQAPPGRWQMHDECLRTSDRRALSHSLTMLCNRIRPSDDELVTVATMRDISKYIFRAAIWAWDRLIDGAEGKFVSGTADEEAITSSLRDEGGYLLCFEEKVCPRPCWGYEAFLQDFGCEDTKGRPVLVASPTPSSPEFTCLSDDGFDENDLD